MFFNYPTAESNEENQSVVFLEHWTEDKWKKQDKNAEFLRFNAGSYVIRKGDEVRSLFIVLEGHLGAFLSTHEDDSQSIKLDDIHKGQVTGGRGRDGETALGIASVSVGVPD